jgi:uncharacterized protein (DUF1501 family)
MAKVSRRAFLNKMLVATEPTHTSGRTLVCVFLRGGADTLNMLVPYGDADYYKVRPTIAISPPRKTRTASVIAINDFYGLHPNLSPLLNIFGEGRLAFVQGVGSDNSSGSHFDAQDQFERGESYRKSIGGGWLGRYLQSKVDHTVSPLSAVSIGTSVSESLHGAPAASALTSVDEACLKVADGELAHVAQALSDMYGAEVGLLANAGKDALQLNARVEKLKKNMHSSTKNVEYPDTEFGKGLRQLSQLIKAEVGLEVATIDYGGWDTHFFQGAAEGIQATNMLELAKGLASFDEDLGSHRGKVTTIVVTEFGRRTYENGSQGTDHGRGFALFAMGAGITGGRVHGQWPGINHQNQDLLGPSGLPIAFDYRSVLGEVLRGCLQAQHLDKVFPQFQLASVGLVSAKQCPQIL